MKVRSTKKEHRNYSIDYENGIICKALTVNNRLKEYSFHIDKERYWFVEDINGLLATPFSEHYKFLNPKYFKNITQLKEFNDFEKLFYVGCSRDGMVKNIEGNFKSSLIVIDSIFCWVWKEIKGLVKSQAIKNTIDKHPWVKKCDVVEYTDYDIVYNDNTLRIEVIPDEKFLNDVLLELNTTHVNDQVKIKIFDEISK